jgi:hypothetical protein
VKEDKRIGYGDKVRDWRHDFFLAAGLLGLAVIIGFMFHWPLVQASLRGNLTTLLDQKRQERREVALME